MIMFLKKKSEIGTYKSPLVGSRSNQIQVIFSEI